MIGNEFNPAHVIACDTTVYTLLRIPSVDV